MAPDAGKRQEDHSGWDCGVIAPTGDFILAQALKGTFRHRNPRPLVAARFESDRLNPSEWLGRFAEPRVANGFHLEHAGGRDESRRICRRSFLGTMPAWASIGWIAGCGDTAKNSAGEFPDLSSVPADLEVPAITAGDPAPGRRVAGTILEYEGTDVHHVLYLPLDWQPGRLYPLIVEYAGNGDYSNDFGDVSTGEVEGSKLGYGLSAGEGYLWLCLPYVNRAEGRNQKRWWGDVEATAEYCRTAVRQVCERYGGDTSAIILAGFSRGAIACNFIGLHDGSIADIWLSFLPYSHYDGVREWKDYQGSDRASALERLNRLAGRASFVCHERSIDDTKRYIEASGVKAPFTFEPIRFRNHNDAWTLRDIPERRKAREWLRAVVAEKPGTHSVRGRVIGRAGVGLAGARVGSGAHHWTVSREDGSFELAGLIGRTRAISASHPLGRFEQAEVSFEQGHVERLQMRAR